MRSILIATTILLAATATWPTSATCANVANTTETPINIQNKTSYLISGLEPDIIFVETTTQPQTMDAAEIQVVMPTTTEGIGSAASPIYSIEQIKTWLPETSGTAALVNALLASFSVILVSELGDKTFIITAIMAMKNSRSLVFISSASALLVMTILSVCMGVAVTVIPKVYTHYASIVLFVGFGLKMLKEAYDLNADEDEQSEFDEVKRSLEAENELVNSKADEQKGAPQIVQLEAALPNKQLTKVQPTNEKQQVGEQQQQVGSHWISKLSKTVYVAPIVFKVFTMIFVAEWGDRSQISTVILAAREDVVGVFVGSLSGHVFCTGLAVIGGRFVADMISVRTMTLIGAIIFLFFAIFAIATGPEV